MSFVGIICDRMRWQPSPSIALWPVINYLSLKCFLRLADEPLETNGLQSPVSTILLSPNNKTSGKLGSMDKTVLCNKHLASLQLSIMQFFNGQMWSFCVMKNRGMSGHAFYCVSNARYIFIAPWRNTIPLIGNC